METSEGQHAAGPVISDEAPVALVTGGSSGIGAALVRSLIDMGSRTVVADVAEGPGSEMACRNGGRFVRTDVTCTSDVAAAVAAATEIGGLRWVVTSAGRGRTEPTVRRGPDGIAVSHALESFRGVVGLNLLGSFDVVRQAAAAMVDQSSVTGRERGAVVMISSIEAMDGQAGQVAYAAAKAAVCGMALPMARDLSEFGIRVNVVAPGFVDTPIYGAGDEAERFKQELAQDVPFPRRLGRAEEVAELVLACLTNGYLNGETIRLDGAVRLRPSLPERPERVR